MWIFVHKMAEIDLGRKAEGCGLDELNAHRFLEQLHETMTVVEMRDQLRKTGAILPNQRPKLVPLVHYILFRYNVNWHTLVNTCGDNSEELEQAQKMLNEVSEAFAESERQTMIARQAEAALRKEEDEARASEQIARDAEEAARQKEAPFKAAHEELEAAVANVKAEEDLRNRTTEDLKIRSETGSTVQQSKAKVELAQHLAKDPLPLQKAKITLEAARKKAEKARAPFEVATAAAAAARSEAEKQRAEAEAARAQAESARVNAEHALEQAKLKVAEVEAFLEEVKRKPGKTQGSIWWMERELQEKKKYLPKSKQ
jgi:hypothetical protein